MTDCWIEMGEIRRYFVQKRGQVVTLVETKGGGEGGTAFFCL